MRSRTASHVSSPPSGLVPRPASPKDVLSSGDMTSGAGRKVYCRKQGITQQTHATINGQGSSELPWSDLFRLVLLGGRRCTSYPVRASTVLICIKVIPIASFADLIDGVDDPGIAGQGGETPGLVT